MIELKLKDWEEFKKERTYNPRYKKCGIACPHCGSEIVVDSMIVLTSYPPQSNYYCDNCGWHGSA